MEAVPVYRWHCPEVEYARCLCQSLTIYMCGTCSIRKRVHGELYYVAMVGGGEDALPELPVLHIQVIAFMTQSGFGL